MAPGAPREYALEGGEAAQDEAPESPQEREEASQREEDGGVEEADDDEEAPTHLPFAPSSEVRGPLSYVYCSHPSPTTSDVALESPPHCHSFEQLASWKEVFGWLSAALLMLDLMLVIFCSCLMTRQQLIPATLSPLYGSYYPRVPMWRKSSGKRRV